MNAFDTAYEGITLEDFTALNHWYDEQGILWCQVPNTDQIPDYSFDPNKERPHAEHFAALMKGLVTDCRKFWVKKSVKEQKGHLAHTVKFCENADYQQELYNRAYMHWVESTPEDNIMQESGRLGEFLET